jgi:C_GCAxxG_C_C family probable redox protein
MDAAAQRAVDRFAEGFSCSQAVLAAFAPDLGVAEPVALRLASTFGGGVARRGHLCGAVSGGLMALGLACGHADNSDTSKSATCALVGGFIERFEAEHGSLMCRTLTGHALDTPEGLEGAKASGVFKTICPGLVATAARLVADVIAERPKRDDASQ